MLLKPEEASAADVWLQSDMPTGRLSVDDSRNDTASARVSKCQSVQTGMSSTAIADTIAVKSAVCLRAYLASQQLAGPRLLVLHPALRPALHRAQASQTGWVARHPPTQPPTAWGHQQTWQHDNRDTGVMPEPAWQSWTGAVAAYVQLLHNTMRTAATTQHVIIQSSLSGGKLHYAYCIG
jgi:hypothetical protein